MPWTRGAGVLGLRGGGGREKGGGDGGGDGLKGLGKEGLGWGEVLRHDSLHVRWEEELWF